MIAAEVATVVSPLIRKYDWHVEQVEDDVKLTINDGQEFASSLLKDGEDIKAETEKLIKHVDAHEYVTIG